MRVRALSLLLALAFTPALAADGPSSPGVPSVNGHYGAINLHAGDVGAQPCYGTCAALKDFLPQLVTVTPTASSTDIETAIPDAPGGPITLEFRSGTIRACPTSSSPSTACPLASFVATRYGVAWSQMAALFTAAGATTSTQLPATPPTLAQLGAAANDLSNVNPTTAKSALGLTGALTAASDNSVTLPGATAVTGSLTAYGKVTVQNGFTLLPALSYSSVSNGYKAAMRNFVFRYWDDNNTQNGATANVVNMPRLRPTVDNTSSAQNGLIDNTQTKPGFWQMCQGMNVLYADWQMTGSAIDAAMIGKQWAYIKGQYTYAQLTNAASSDNLVHLSDDWAWEENFLVQAYEVTGDDYAIHAAVDLFAAGLYRFRDPFTAGAYDGALLIPAHGILYNDGDTSTRGAYASSYEIMAANAALKIYQLKGYPNFLHYAQATYGWTKQYLLGPAGYLYTNLLINPASFVGGQPIAMNGSQDTGNVYGAPRPGLSASHSGGTMAYMVAGARLYQLTNLSSYLTDVENAAAAFPLLTVFGRTSSTFGLLLLNDRDPWTDGYWAPYVASEALTLAGVDTSGLLRGAFQNTANSIASQVTGQGTYPGDWSGPEADPNGNTTYAQRAAAGYGTPTGSGGLGQADPSQLMTDATSISEMQAGFKVNSWSLRQ